MKEAVLDFLEKEQEARIKKAQLTFSLLINHPAGIGDHSTGDYYSNCREALDELNDAEGKLELINRMRYTQEDGTVVYPPEYCDTTETTLFT